MTQTEKTLYRCVVVDGGVIVHEFFSDSPPQQINMPAYDWNLAQPITDETMTVPPLAPIPYLYAAHTDKTVYYARALEIRLDA